MAREVYPGATRWLARGEQELPSSGAWLTVEESAHASEMSFTKRRTEYLLRRWVCKRAVATVIGLPDDLPSLARIGVTNQAGGAPAVVIDGVETQVEVSLSDRAGWAICVVREKAYGKVGCDLEIVEPRSPGFIADFLTAAEQEYVASQRPADQDLAATLVWSAKECGLKVLQTGLARDTRSVEVVVEDARSMGGWARLEVSTAEGDALHGWWRRAGSYLMTVTAESSLDAPSELAGSGDLETARPLHSWVDQPLSE